MYGDERTDDELMKAHQKGDNDALSVLLKRHLHNLERYVNYRMASPNLVDDVVNETMTRIFKTAGSFRFESSFETWIKAIAKGICVDIYRKEKSRTKLNVVEEHLEYSTPNQKEFAESIVTVLTVREALERLPDDQRIPLEMQSQGMSEKEISEELGVPAGTIKSRSARGRESLRLLLKDFDPKIRNQTTVTHDNKLGGES